MRIRTDRKSLKKGYSRAKFYIGHFARYWLVPDSLMRRLTDRRIRRLSDDERRAIEKRIDYYVKLPDGATPDDGAVAVKDFRYPFGKKKKFSAYFFDLYELVRCCPAGRRFSYLFGDIADETSCAAFVKSRPVAAGATNSVLVKLDSVRHFAFVKDSRDYLSKKDLLVFRNIVRNQPWRTRFLEMYHNHPLCDAGCVNDDSYVTDRAHIKPFMTIDDQLDYKFICCIEGHDVATNLKWVMSSNSIAVMPRPKVESWFMEGSLIPDHHYIEIAEDYSDLPEKLRFYLDNPDKALAIIRNAHEYVAQFTDSRRELLIGRMTARRYFEKVSNEI